MQGYTSLVNPIASRRDSLKNCGVIFFLQFVVLQFFFTVFTIPFATLYNFRSRLPRKIKKDLKINLRGQFTADDNNVVGIRPMEFSLYDKLVSPVLVCDSYYDS